jgi:hypothetical protein
MDPGSQCVASALSRMQERDGLRSRAGKRSLLVRSESDASDRTGYCSREASCWRTHSTAAGSTSPTARVDLGQSLHPELQFWLLRITAPPDGGMELDPDFYSISTTAPTPPRAARGGRVQGGDCATEIFQ